MLSLTFSKAIFYVMKGFYFLEFLGRTEVRIADILQMSLKSRGPILKMLPLHEVDSGEVALKLDLRLFDSR